MNVKTTFMNHKDCAEAQKWLLVDAKGMILGRLASRVAHLIMGKHRSVYTRHMNGGDVVVIINAEKIALSGNKWNDKMYHRHTGYVGHLRSVPYKDLLQKKPTFIIEKAVKGMLPKGRLGRKLFAKNLKVYAGFDHPHAAQHPIKINLEDMKVIS